VDVSGSSIALAGLIAAIVFGFPWAGLAQSSQWIAGEPVDVSKFLSDPSDPSGTIPGNELEASIAINPKNPNELVIVSIAYDPPETCPGRDGDPCGLLAAYSSDGGDTWTPLNEEVSPTDRLIGEPGETNLPLVARWDPVVAWDDYGNLFLTYLSPSHEVVVALFDPDPAEMAFKEIAVFEGIGFGLDKPWIATGPADPDGDGVVDEDGDGVADRGSVWLAYMVANDADGDSISLGVRHAVLPDSCSDDESTSCTFTCDSSVPAGPDESCGEFSPEQVVPSSPMGYYPSIAVGSDGRVLVAYQDIGCPPETPSCPGWSIHATLDLDGVRGGVFVSPTYIENTRVGETYAGWIRLGNSYTRAQRDRSLSTNVAVAYDRSPGQSDRAYIVYMDHPQAATANWEHLSAYSGMHYSEDGGSTWSPASDSEDNWITALNYAGDFLNFLPAIAVDQTSGNVVIAWHTTHLDQPPFIGSDTDGWPRTDTDLEVFVGDPVAWIAGRQGMRGLLPARRDSHVPPSSNHNRANYIVPDDPFFGTEFGWDHDYGDYLGVAYHDDCFHPAWGDNFPMVTAFLIEKTTARRPPMPTLMTATMILTATGTDAMPTSTTAARSVPRTSASFRIRGAEPAKPISTAAAGSVPRTSASSKGCGARNRGRLAWAAPGRLPARRVLAAP
jgi:hypothetical protein